VPKLEAVHVDVAATSREPKQQMNCSRGTHALSDTCTYPGIACLARAADMLFSGLLTAAKCGMPAVDLKSATAVQLPLQRATHRMSNQFHISAAQYLIGVKRVSFCAVHRPLRTWL